MIREVNEHFTINVQVKNGFLFTKCDVPELFVNETGSLLSFWFENKLKIYLMSEIAYFEVVEDKK